MPVTEVVKVAAREDYSDTISRAAEVLRDGGLVAFPTETVYGLGVRADSPEAVARLREVKDRKGGKPFTVHIGRREEVHQYVPSLSGAGRRLAMKGWPGPLTLILSVDDVQAVPGLAGLKPGTAEALYHEGTIGVRCPDDAAATDLLTAVRAPVVAASANLAGGNPPSDAATVQAALDGSVDLILDGGPTRYAKASTIVRVNAQACEVVREGVYDERTIHRLASLNVLLVCTGNTCRSPMAEGLLRALAADALGVEPDELPQRGIHVSSAGIFAAGGGHASSEAVEVMRQRGIDISAHRSQPVTGELINQADLVLTMTEAHRHTILQMDPSAEQRCDVISGEHDIDDPIGRPLQDYALCARDIETALKDRLTEILA